MSPWSVTAFGSRGRRIACLNPGALKPVSERRTQHRCLPKLGSSMNLHLDRRFGMHSSPAKFGNPDVFPNAAQSPHQGGSLLDLGGDEQGLKLPNCKVLLTSSAPMPARPSAWYLSSTAPTRSTSGLRKPGRNYAFMLLPQYGSNLI